MKKKDKHLIKFYKPTGERGDIQPKWITVYDCLFGLSSPQPPAPRSTVLEYTKKNEINSRIKPSKVTVGTMFRYIVQRVFRFALA